MDLIIKLDGEKGNSDRYYPHPVTINWNLLKKSLTFAKIPQQRRIPNVTSGNWYIYIQSRHVDVISDFIHFNSSSFSYRAPNWSITQRLIRTSLKIEQIQMCWGFLLLCQQVTLSLSRLWINPIPSNIRSVHRHIQQQSICACVSFRTICVCN